MDVPSGGTASDVDGFQFPTGAPRGSSEFGPPGGLEALRVLLQVAHRVSRRAVVLLPLPLEQHHLQRQASEVDVGVVFEDTNGNGVKDPEEDGIPDVEVVITDSNGDPQTVTTDSNGEYTAVVPPGVTVIDIDETTLPPDADRTEGTDPTSVDVPSGGTASDIDGFQFPTGAPSRAPVSPGPPGGLEATSSPAPSGSPSESPSRSPAPTTPGTAPPTSSPAPSASPTGSPTGTVTGVVFEDTDGNGMKDPGEDGIPGVEVVITDSNGDPQTVTTDSNGEYTAVVPPGPTIVDVDETTLPDPDSTQTAGTDPTSFDVPPGETVSDFDGFQSPTGTPTGSPTKAPIATGSPTASPTATETGTVTGVIYEDTNGNGVKDTEEDGIPNVEVVITDSNGDSQTVTTDSNGEYTAVVPPGVTVIDIDETTLPPDAERTEGTDPTSVDVPSGGTASDIDGFQFPTGAPSRAPVSPGPPGGLEATSSPAPSASEMGSIAGNVTCMEEGNTMSPLSGVTIELLDIAGEVVASTTTNGDGDYEFTDVAPGTYFVNEINSEECPNSVSDQDEDPDDDGPDETDSDTTVDDLIGVTVNPGESDTGNNFVDGTTPSESPTTSPTTPAPSSAPSTSPTKSPAPSAAPSKGSNASICGKVSDETLTNGLAGATITLYTGTAAIETNIKDTYVTTDDGEYCFTGLAAGEYTVTEKNPESHPVDISDFDADEDGDAADSDTATDNTIGVTLQPNEDDLENNFVDSNLGSIAGNVTCMEEGNTMSPLSGVTIELLDIAGEVVASTTTNGDGDYEFTDVAPGTYFVNEINSEECPNSVSDQDEDPDDDGPDETDSDTTVDDLIGVTVNPGESDTGNNFVDGNAAPSESPTTSPAPSSAPSTSPTKSPAPSAAPSMSTNASICGKVSDETLTNGLAGATITLYTGTAAIEANIIDTYVTTDDGEYCFTGLAAGEYTVTEKNPESHPVDISDFDADEDGDAADSDTATDNTIGVTLQPNEDDLENNFVDSNLGSIAGNVTCMEEGNTMSPLSGVTIELLDSVTVEVVASTTTNGNGEYEFTDVAPGTYFVNEINSEECPNSVSDQDEDPDDDGPDETDSDTTVDDLIGVTVNPGESDTGNNFVDGNAAPSESPTTSPAPSSAPSTSPTKSPAPSAAPSMSTNASICGKVSDETLTNGLAGATITLYTGTAGY